MENIKVLYEDNHVIAVVKPAGVLSQGDSTGKESIFDEVKKYLKKKYNKPGNVFLGLVHRLDQPVSGIMLFAKTSKGASRLSEQFRSHTIQKTYHCLVRGRPKIEKGELKGKVSKISLFAEGFGQKSDKEILEAVKKATKTRTAELSYEVIKFNENYSLLKILPKTGRFHQIRVQLSEMGNPIVGDIKYGSKEKLPGGSPDGKATENPRQSRGIALCATGISFKTATGDKTIDLKIDFPENWKELLNNNTY